jgi:2-polyprenyl-3-methyl-5-hydroxy-6-metoxy-1,4-benzoquinol methylase
VCDAHRLTSLNGTQYDAVCCSHNLEHHYRHDGRKVIQGIAHILKQEGFVEVRVPDIGQVIRAVTEMHLDLDEKLCNSAAGRITAHEITCGFQTEIVASGRDYYAHKTAAADRKLTT